MNESSHFTVDGHRHSPCDRDSRDTHNWKLIELSKQMSGLRSTISAKAKNDAEHLLPSCAGLLLRPH